MDIVSILGLGAVGLGFLLALLAYRLLAQGRTRERPVYIFMAFCLVVMGIGAALQFVDNQNRMVGGAALGSMKSSLDQAQDQNKRLAEAMKSIVAALEPTQGPLQVVQNHVTDGEACGGGSSGKPLPHGKRDGDNISTALQGIASALTSAKQFVAK